MAGEKKREEIQKIKDFFKFRSLQTEEKSQPEPSNKGRGGRLWEPWKGDYDMRVREDFNGRPWRYGHEKTDIRWNCTDTPENRADPNCQLQYGEYWKKAKWDYEQSITYTKPRWNYNDDWPEPESAWFTHPEFKDPDGYQNYYFLRKRHYHVREGNATDLGLNRYKWYPVCSKFPQDPPCEDSNPKGICECCNSEDNRHGWPEDVYLGCTVGWPTQCEYVYYTDENGDEQEVEARQWCPESQQEINEVYAHSINQQDPNFLSNDLNTDKLPTWLGGLPIMQLWAKWLVHVEYRSDDSFKDRDDKDKGRNYVFDQKYNRFNIATGIQLKKYYPPSYLWEDEEKKSIACENDRTWATRIQADDSFNPREIFRGQGKFEVPHPDNEGTVDEGRSMYAIMKDKDDLWADSLGYVSCTRVAMVMDLFGKEGTQVDGQDKSRWEWFIKTEATHCESDLIQDSRPMCVVSGADVPDAIKNQAIDIQKEGLLAEKIIKRQNEIQTVLSDIEWWKGIIPSIVNIIKVTYGFLLCCCCCCKTPLCWEGWWFGKGGCCWEGPMFAPCRIFCYGGLCGWRCRQKVKDEEAADIVEAERKKAAKEAESSSSSSGSSSSSDSD